MLKAHFKKTFVILMPLLFSYLFCGSVYAGSGENAKMVDVKVLSMKGCQATPQTIKLVESVAKEMNINIKLTEVVVKTPEQAQKNRFIGSPTVRINGVDIDPDSRKIERFGVT
ncbi:MAG: thioredoxin family protein [Deltaproteobacteria bacterium]